MTEEPTDVVSRDRFSAGPARSFLTSMPVDERIFHADLAVDRAHVIMLAEQNIIDDDVTTAILNALSTIETKGFDDLPDAEDIHAAIETAVIDQIGEAGGHIHTARSRNDEITTCIRYQLRTDLLTTLTDLTTLRATLLDAAETHRTTLMPGYTHQQPAQPTTVAHWMLSYENTIARDTTRLLAAYDHINQSPLGAAAFAGTPFDIDRHRTATLLGFDSVIENAMDAVSTRDFLLETSSALATLAITLSNFAEDIIGFAKSGYIELDDDYASTSSIMPQKKNPDTLELVRASTGDVTGGLSALITILKGLPRAYNRDLQRATKHAWATIDAVADAVPVATGAIATAHWNESALTAAADDGFSTATGVADMLAAAGIPFRTAHQIVAKSAELDGDYETLQAATEDVLDKPLESITDPETIKTALEPASNVAMRDSYGGPAPSAVTDAIKSARETLTTDIAHIEDNEAAIQRAASNLQSEVETYVS